jgi:hypothetical protein
MRVRVPERKELGCPHYLSASKEHDTLLPDPLRRCNWPSGQYNPNTETALVNTRRDFGSRHCSIFLLAIHTREGKTNLAQAGTDLEKAGNFQARHAGNVAGEVLHLVGKFFIDAP